METVCGKQSGSRCVLIMVRDVFLKTSMKIVALFHNKPVCYIYGRGLSVPCMESTVIGG